MILLHLLAPQGDSLAYPKPKQASGGDLNLGPLPGSPGDQREAFWRDQQGMLSGKEDNCLELRHEDICGSKNGVRYRT
jgi:hypothetical protein